MGWAGLVAAIHNTFILPCNTALNISTAVSPGLSGRDSTLHKRATSLRCAALAGSRWPGSRLAMPPASRPPMALGWPVRENGPDPGFPICPVAKCRWISAAFLAVPLLAWSRHMVYREDRRSVVLGRRVSGRVYFGA